ncbi:MAG: S-layer homology domain-containing protein [Candidatus Cloacimonetes bacterium]|nr:S-layer homology domain-containing protein [Candidatus Cloacimonadota bacterium]
MKKFAIAGILSAAFMVGNAFAASPFQDIDPSHWSYQKIKYLYDHGIIRGQGSGRFNGEERISRYEASALVFQALKHVKEVQGQGGSVDSDIMDTINSLMTELTDEMQVIEVRIEENSDAIAQLRNHVSSANGKPTQGVSMPMGQGRIKFMGQAMFSLVSGGADSFYSSATTNNSAVAPTAANLGSRSGVTEFTNDYFMLGIAADIDEKTSFYAKANVYTGGNAGAKAGASNGLEFDDYMYMHVKDLWSDWDLTAGRFYVPWGHEVAGAFGANPYFVSNSLIDTLYGNMITGAYFSTESDNGDWDWGIGLHNGDFGSPLANYSYLYPTTAISGAAGSQVAGAAGNPAAGSIVNGFGQFNTAGANAFNTNADDNFGFILHVGSQSNDGDFKWDLNYFTNGGDISQRAANAGAAGFGAMNFFNLGMDYRVSEDWLVGMEYVSGNVEVQDAGRAALLNKAAPNNNIFDDDFTTWNFQVVYNLDSKSTLSLRHSEHSMDRSGARLAATSSGSKNFNDEVGETTFAYARKVSDNGTLFLEYNTSDYDKVGGMTKKDITTVNGTVAAVNTRADYDVLRASYRIDF